MSVCFQNHANQIGHRIGFHFFHDAAALIANRVGAGPEPQRNLFDVMSGHQLLEDLTLALRQPADFRGHGLTAGRWLAALFRLRERVTDGVQQLLIAARLLQQID